MDNVASIALIRALCGSETRFRVVRVLYGAPDLAFPLRGLAARAAVKPAQVKRLLPSFVRSGLCEVIPAVPLKKYRATRNSPVAVLLTKIFRQADAYDDGEMVRVEQAPVLRLLLWTGRRRETIPAYEAFRHYENSWRFVQGMEMDAGERRLLNRLRKRYGMVTIAEKSSSGKRVQAAVKGRSASKLART